MIKVWIFLVTLCACANAQFNLLTAVPDDAKVAKVNGREVTAGEIRKLLTIMPDQFVRQVYNTNPQYAIQQMYMMAFLAEEGARKKVDDDPDIKAQLEVARNNILAAAMLSFEQNHFTPTQEAITEFYTRNAAEFEQAKVRAIGVTFKTPGGVAAAEPNCDAKCMEEKMKQSLQAQASAANRTEAEALVLAKEAAEKLRGGADIEKVFAAYSDDPALKATSGALVIKLDSPQSPATKKEVMALKPGQVSEPLKQPAAYYVFVMGEKSPEPQADVALAITQQLRQQHMKEWFEDVAKRFTPEVLNSQFFTQPAPGTTPAK